MDELAKMRDFPPLYTKQVNQETLAKQLVVWGDIVLAHCRQQRLVTLDVNEALASPLFSNAKINRKVSLDFAQTIIDHLVKQGNAQWEGNSRTRCMIIWRTPEQWASLIHAWVNERGMNNTVVTLFELQQGEDTQDTAFHKLETPMLLKALEVLQKRGQAQIFQVDTETGVKFF